MARPLPRPGEADGRRRRDLARMRLLATGLLVLMSLVFVATRLAPPRWLWTQYLAAFAEAGMVGALADWFAVTALFRRPLGLPIPHTAIIPRNKARIGAALGDFIAGNFLTPRVLDQRLRELDPAGRAAAWLADPATARALAEQIAGFVPEIARSGEELGAFVGDVARRIAAAVPAAPMAARILGLIWGGAAAQRLLDRGTVLLGEYLRERREVVREKVSQNSWRWLPKWVDRILADKITAGLVRAVEEMADPDHPWRIELKAAVEAFIHRLATDPETIARGEALKTRFLHDPAFLAHVRGVWLELEARLNADPQGAARLTRDAVERALVAIGRWLMADALARERLNGFARVAVRRTIAPRREAIGAFVAEVVAGWDAAAVVEKLELQVGKDLQYIRINGTLVGGLAGLIIFTLARLLS
ncbi:MAG TPA: DUF445 domain-containing protein [Caulobacteraceae bacterium]